MSTRYIPDLQVVQAYADAKALREEGHYLLATDILVQHTRLLRLVCKKACERAVARGLIDWTGSPSQGWPSKLGQDMLDLAKPKPRKRKRRRRPRSRS